MKKIFLFLLLTIHYSPFTSAQEIPVNTEQQLENQTSADEGETEDDSYLQELEHFKKNPASLNTADADELKQLKIITDLQIANLISYRNLFGKLISIYELQSVPSWDINSIKKILPFVTINSPLSIAEEMGKRFAGGEHTLLLRISRVMEKSEGFDKKTTGTKYLGSPQKIFFRYRYTYKNLLQFGITADKDAGEQFLKGRQSKGFDFYSFHLFARKIGIIRALAIGDFSVNMGQGLIQWQGLAFKKSAEVMGGKRQSAVLRPYTSAGEFYFHRGAGITISKGKIESTAFVSFRKLGGNFDTDGLTSEDFISSFLTSGFHRTATENENKNNFKQTAFGGNMIYKNSRWQVGVNGIYYAFSLPVQKRDEPYNLYAISGKNWYNFSVDYSYTYKNFHFFGEAAADKNLNKAFVNGLLISADPSVDISFVHRCIHKAFQSINGNAFTESTSPSNENGFYAGISIRPAQHWRLDAYADFFKFPWLKYLADAPSCGKDYLAQLTYTPGKQAEIYTRFKTETKESNQPDNISATNFLVSIPKQSWRTQINYKLNSAISFRNRIELLWYDKKGINKESGFLTFFDILYKPLMKPLSAAVRLQYFETSGYNSRIYAYENDVLYAYSIPALFDEGFRYYITLNYDVTRKISFWLRLAQTIYNNKSSIGSGLDEIQGNTKTELKLQLRYIL